MLCNNCKNSDVCKYKITVQDVENYIKEKNAPLVIDLKCKYQRVIKNV